MTLEPGGDIHQQGETGGVGFGKAVLPEAKDLLVDPAGKILLITALHHALYQP